MGAFGQLFSVVCDKFSSLLNSAIESLQLGEAKRRLKLAHMVVTGEFQYLIVPKRAIFPHLSFDAIVAISRKSQS